MICADGIDGGQFSLAVELCVPGTLAILEFPLDCRLRSDQSVDPDINVLDAVMRGGKYSEISRLFDFFDVSYSELAIGCYKKPLVAVTESDNLRVFD